MLAVVVVSVRTAKYCLLAVMIVVAWLVEPVVQSGHEYSIKQLYFHDQ